MVIFLPGLLARPGDGFGGLTISDSFSFDR